MSRNHHSADLHAQLLRRASVSSGGALHMRLIVTAALQIEPFGETSVATRSMGGSRER